MLTTLAALTGCARPETDVGPAAELRLGYFATVTHAPALVGIHEGLLADALDGTELTPTVFDAGPTTIEAISAGALDAAYIGPSPAINSHLKSGGQSAVIVAGATTGGAQLVVREGIDTAADLPGATLATPQLGNTQDVALRAWLADHDLAVPPTGDGPLTIQPGENSTTLTLFRSGDLDGAWLPEPWASRLVVEAGAKVLIDEAELWPDGEFPTTVLLVNRDFAAAHPETVDDLVAGHAASVAWLDAHPDEAAAVIGDQLEQDTGSRLDPAVLGRALQSVRFSVDPVASAYPTLLEHAVQADLSSGGDLDGLIDLRAVNVLRGESGAEPVSAGGLGEE